MPNKSQNSEQPDNLPCMISIFTQQTLWQLITTIFDFWYIALSLLGPAHVLGRLKPVAKNRVALIYINDCGFDYCVRG